MPTLRSLSNGAPLIYRLTRWVASLSLRLFYRRIDAINLHNLPSTGPVVLAANHPNYIIDALAIAIQTGRHIHFVGKGPLVDRWPVLSPFLRKIGVIPIYRPSDDPHRQHDNRGSYDRCAEHLETGGIICMFSEGRSHPDPHVRELRTGTARIVLETEARSGYRLGVQVVPVGLFFPEEDRYFTDGVVVFGKPILLDPFCAQHRDRPGHAVRALTKAIQADLRHLTLHLPDPAWASFVDQMHDLIRWGDDVPPSEALHLRQRISTATENFRDREPYQAQTCRDQLDDLWQRSEAWRRHQLPQADPIAQRRSISRRLRDAVALPLATVGFTYHAIPYLIPKLWARYLVPSREKKAFIKFLIGAPVFVTWYGLTFRALDRRSSSLAYAWTAVGPLTGLLALRSRAHRRRWFDAWRNPRSATHTRLGARIAADRAALLETFVPWLDAAGTPHPEPEPSIPGTLHRSAGGRPYRRCRLDPRWPPHETTRLKSYRQTQPSLILRRASTPSPHSRL